MNDDVGGDFSTGEDKAEAEGHAAFSYGSFVYILASNLAFSCLIFYVFS